MEHSTFILNFDWVQCQKIRTLQRWDENGTGNLRFADIILKAHNIENVIQMLKGL